MTTIKQRRRIHPCYGIGGKTWCTGCAKERMQTWRSKHRQKVRNSDLLIGFRTTHFFDQDIWYPDSKEWALKDAFSEVHESFRATFEHLHQWRRSIYVEKEECFKVLVVAYWARGKLKGDMAMPDYCWEVSTQPVNAQPGRLIELMAGKISGKLDGDEVRKVLPILSQVRAEAHWERARPPKAPIQPDRERAKAMAGIVALAKEMRQEARV